MRRPVRAIWAAASSRPTAAGKPIIVVCRLMIPAHPSHRTAVGMASGTGPPVHDTTSEWTWTDPRVREHGKQANKLDDRPLRP